MWPSRPSVGSEGKSWLRERLQNLGLAGCEGGGGDTLVFSGHNRGGKAQLGWEGMGQIWLGFDSSTGGKGGIPGMLRVVYWL